MCCGAGLFELQYLVSFISLGAAEVTVAVRDRDRERGRSVFQKSSRGVFLWSGGALFILRLSRNRLCAIGEDGKTFSWHCPIDL
jgi:hypothetical protein